MNDIDVTDRAALSLLLRSKTALGRLVETEVHAVLDFLESIGFVHQGVAPAPVDELAPFDPPADASTIVPPPVEPAPVIAPPPVS